MKDTHSDNADRLYDSAPVAYFTLDEKGIIRQCNPAAARLLGCDREWLTGHGLLRFVRQSDQPGFSAFFEQLLRGKPAAPCRAAMHTPEGTVRHLRLEGSRPDPEDGAVRCLLAAIDLTGQLETENALREEAGLLRELEEVARTGHYEADLATMTFRFSDGMYRLFGEAPQAFQPTLGSIDSRSHPEDVPVVKAILDRAATDHKPYHYTRRIYRPDGELRLLEAHGKVITGPGGKAVKLIGLVQDITERQRAERELAETKDLLQTIFDTSPTSITTYQPVYRENRIDDFQVVFVNAFTQKTAGVNPTGLLLTQTFPTAKGNGFFDKLRQVTEQKQMQDFELWYEGEGMQHWFRMIAVPMEEMVLVTTEDITERKNAGQELKQREDLLQTVFDVSLNPIAYHKAIRDESGTIVDFEFQLENQEARKYASEDRTGKRYSEAYPGIKDTEVFRLYCDVVETGKELNREVQLNLRGTARWFHLMAAKLGDGLVATAVDITERKKAEQEILRLKEEVARKATDKYQLIFNSIDEGFCVLEVLYDEEGKAVDYRFAEVNPTFKRQTGLKNVTGKTFRSLFTTEPQWMDTYDKVVKTGEPAHFEDFHKGTGRSYQVQASRIGNSTSLAIVFQDITERKEREASIMLSKEVNEALLQVESIDDTMNALCKMLGAHFGASICAFSEVDEAEGMINVGYAWHVNDAQNPVGIYRIHDFHSSEVLQLMRSGKPEIVQDTSVFPEEVIKNMQALKIGAYVNFPFVRNGQWHATLSIVKNKPYVWREDEIELMRELTSRIWTRLERVRVEEALRISEEKYRSLFESIDEGFCIIELIYNGEGKAVDYTFLEVNKVFQQQTGLVHAAGKRVMEIAPATEPYWVEQYRHVAETGNSVRFENYTEHNNRWYQINANRIGNAGSRLVAIIFDDITQRKEREAHQTFLLKLSDAMRVEPDADAVANRAIQMLIEQMGLDRSYIFSWNLQDDVGYVTHQVGNDRAPALPPVIRPSGFPDSVQVSAEGTLVINDIFEHPNLSDSDRVNIAGLGMRALVSATLRKWDHPLWSIVAVSAEPRHWTQSEITLVEEVAERTWAAMERAKAEEALRRSEEKYRTLFETMAQGYCEIELVRDDTGRAIDQRYLEINPAFERLIGLPVAHALGRTATEVYPGVEDIWTETLDRVARSRRPERIEHRLAQMDRWFEMFSYPSHGDRVVVLYEDVTERKRREVNLAFLASLMSDFAPLGSVEEIMELTGKRLAEHLGLSRYLFVEILPEAGTCTYLLPSRPDGQLEISGSFILADFHTEAENRLLSAGHSMVVNDVRDGTRTPEQIAAFETFNIASIVNTPYISNGRWVFNLGVTRKEPSVWRADEIELLREISVRLWLRIERARAEEALKGSEEKYRTLFNSIDEGFVLYEIRCNESGRPIDFRYIETNPAFEQQTGLKNVAGKLASEVIPNLEKYWFDYFEEILKSSQALHSEYYNEATNRWYSISGFRAASDRPLIASLFRDITERIRREQQQQYLLQLNDALRSLVDPIQIQRTAAKTIGEFLGADRVYYSEIEDDNEHYIIAENYVSKGVQPLILRGQLSDFGWAREPLAAGEILAMADSQTDPNLDESARGGFRALNIVASLAVPLIKEGRWAAAFVLQHQQPHSWSETEMALAQETAERTWAAVERAKAEKALQQSEERFRTLAATAPAMIWQNNANGENIFANQFFLNYTGKAAEEIAGLEWHKLVHPDQVEAYVASYITAVQTRSIWQNRNLILRHNGEWHWFENYAQPLFDGDGSYLGHVGVSVDIDASVKAEEALRTSEEKYRTLFDSIDEGIAIIEMIYDDKGVIVDLIYRQVNSAYEQQGGVYNVVGRSIFDVIPGVEGHWLERYKQVAKTGEPVREENYQQDMDRWFDVYFTRVDEGGRFVAIVFNDITERKRTEIQLRENYEQLRLATKAAKAGWGRMDYATGASRWDEEGKQIIGFANEEESLTPQGWLNHIHPEDLTKVEAHLANCIEENKPFDIVYRVNRADGEMRFIHAMGGFKKAEDGTLLKGAGLVMDITDRRRREANLTFLANLMSDFAPLGSVEEIIELAARRIAEHFHLSHCSFVAIDLEAGECTILHNSHAAAAPGLMGTYKLVDFHTEEENRLLASGRPMIVNNIDDGTRSREQVAAFEALDIRALVNTPYIDNARWVFNLAVTRSQPCIWQPNEIELLQEVAARVWLRMERARAEEALRKSEAKYRTLFETMDEGFVLAEVIYDEKGRPADALYIEGNPAASRITGVPDYNRRLWSEVLPGAEAYWLEIYDRVARTGVAERLEQFAAPLGRWYDFYVSPVANPEDTRRITVLFQDITGRKQAEQALRKSEEQQAFLLKLSDAIRPLTDPARIMAKVSETVGRYYQAGRCGYAQVPPPYDHLVVERDWTNGAMQSLPGRIPLSGFGDEIIRQYRTGQTIVVEDVSEDERNAGGEEGIKAPGNVRSSISVQLMKGGQWVACFYVQDTVKRSWTKNEVSLMEEIADRTWAALERAKAEEALRQSQQRFQSIANLVPDLLWDSEPDGSTDWYNQRWLEYTGQSFEQAISWGWTDAIHPDDQEGSAKQYGEAVKAGKPLRQEHRIRRYDGAYRWFVVSAYPLQDESGRVVKMYGAASDIHDRKRAEEALRESEERLQKAISIETVGVIFFDPDGCIHDANTAFRRMSGLSHEELVEGKVYWQKLTPPEFMEASRHAIQELLTKGESTPYEKQYIRPDGTRWWGLFAAKRLSEHEIVEFVLDITEAKQAEEALKDFNITLEKQVAERTLELKESRDLLQSVFDTNLLGMGVLHAVWDDEGTLTDFRIGMVNREMENLTGRSDLTGKLYSQEYPGIKQTPLFALMRKVMETEKAESMEYYYPYESFNKWFSSMFVKLDDGLVATNLDITERKRAEEELLLNYQILQQAEEVARIGSWEYDSVTGVFKWSEGMYRLFGLPGGQQVSPQIYREYALAQDRPVAERIIRALQEGQPLLEETLRIGVDGEVLTLKIKAITLINAQGRPLKVLGVDLDITELKRLEAENLKIRLEQQQALLNAIMEAQEEERRRISESLHNGVGQLLYATKLNLAGVQLGEGPDGKVEAARSLRKVEELLTEAIVETRRVSHELVPVLLKDFGLQKAIEEFCGRFAGTGLNLDCHCFRERLPQPLETAIYRIGQELVNNIVKHAGATRALLEVNKDKDFVYIEARDNGKGMEGGSLEGHQPGKGIGMRTIGDRVALLGGTLEVESAPGKGTLIAISIPLR